jgi:Tfp pilus assembly protein PilE
MTRARGITLVELLIATVLMAMLLLAVARTYAIGINFDSRFLGKRDQLAKIHTFEDRLVSLIQHAELARTTTPAQVDSFFIGSVGDVPSTAQGTGTPAPASTITSSSSQGGSSSALSDTLIFTASSLRIPSLQLSSDDDFETQNQKYGPQGGITEFAISCTPFGTPPNGQTGCILRRQCPADDDPSQGGVESVFEPDVTSINFEFFDGTQYDPSWDTRTMTPARLPSCVRITYQLKGESNPRLLTVMLPNSDVTTANPITQTTTP